MAEHSFPIGGTVQGQDLVGREGTLVELFERTYQHKNSVLLSAARQTGKTSVAEELLRRVRAAGGWGIYIDCSAATDDERDLADLIANSTYDQATGSKGAFAKLKDLIGGVPKPMLFQTDLDLSLAFYGGRHESTPRLLTRAFGLADDLASQKDKRCVVVYDEFQWLNRVSPTLIARARAEIQHRMTNTAYVFMGSEVGLLNELFKSEKRMPFRLASPMPLPLPSPADWHVYIAGRFEALRVSVSDSDVDDLIEFAGCHPRDLMEVCEQLLVLRKISPSSPGAIELAKVRTLEGLRAPFEEIWKRLERPKGTWTTAARIAHRQAIYGRGRSRETTARTIEKLEREGVIHKTGRGSYEFTEPLFGAYVRDLTTR